jgi:hypothetical protein
MNKHKEEGKELKHFFDMAINLLTLADNGWLIAIELLMGRIALLNGSHSPSAS